MAELRLSLAAARALHLAAQGLAQPRRTKAVKDDLLQAIRQMGVLQIDTIHVVARSPYLVLWSRLGDYPRPWLEELLAEGALFEYWAHEASFVPVEDYGLYRHRMIDPASMGWKYSHAWMTERQADVAAVLAHIRSNGATRSADFERSDGQGGGGWWGWKPEKRSLEMLFTSGALMIARRHNFQRVYDLAERVLPGWHDERMPAMAETECYTPAAQRRYGYFTLPILRRGALVGRVDAKAHRGAGLFELKSLVLEPGVRVSERFTRDIGGALRRLAGWHGCARLQLTHCIPDSWGAVLRAALESPGAGA